MRTPFFDSPDAAEEGIGCWTPTADILDAKDAVTIIIELPGMDRDDLSVNIESNLLTISGERKAPEEEGETRVIKSERCFGGFCRSFSLTSRIDVDRISAAMDKGILTVTLPYKEESKPKQIEVKIGS
jgi:HSP20 family protein